MIQFRIYPDKKNSKKYYIVKVFPSVQAMRKYHLDTGGMSDETSFRAICRSYQCLSSKGRLKNEIGDILIPEKYCRVGIISHECCHAAIYYFKEKGLVVNDETEEQFCLIQGDLNRQLVNGYYKWVNRT